MNADTYELKTILTLERRYMIPTFQRDYEWTRDGQWELLYDDLDSVADRLEEARIQATAHGEAASKADKRVTSHFLGAIVLNQLLSSAGDIDLSRVRIALIAVSHCWAATAQTSFRLAWSSRSQD